MLIRSERVCVVPGEEAQRISLIESSYLECHSSMEWKSGELWQSAALAPSSWLSGSAALLLLVPLKPIVGKSFFNSIQNVSFAQTLGCIDIWLWLYTAEFIRSNKEKIKDGVFCVVGDLFLTACVVLFYYVTAETFYF